LIESWAAGRALNLPDGASDLLFRYALMIHGTNKRFNLTACADTDAIISRLILESMDPLCDINVPRGTKFIDIGSGSGIPGIPLRILFDGLGGLLIDSNNKKTRFINDVIGELGLSGVRSVCGRAEELVRTEPLRESFDWAFLRAFSNAYTAIEIAAPFVKPGGLIYIFSTLKPGSIPSSITAHAEELGVKIMPHESHIDYGLRPYGLLFQKISITHEKFPRRFAVIKRESSSIREEISS
jgi:16S rRNA (guanine527-N7)-methyltransferase